MDGRCGLHCHSKRRQGRKRTPRASAEPCRGTGLIWRSDRCLCETDRACPDRAAVHRDARPASESSCLLSARPLVLVPGLPLRNCVQHRERLKSSYWTSGGPIPASALWQPKSSIPNSRRSRNGSCSRRLVLDAPLPAVPPARLPATRSLRLWRRPHGT